VCVCVCVCVCVFVCEYVCACVCVCVLCVRACFDPKECVIVFLPCLESLQCCMSHSYVCM